MPDESTLPENPRAVIGANNPPLARSIAAETGDFAAVVTAFLQDEYAQYPGQLEALLTEAAELPATINSTEDKEATASVVKRLRDLNNKFDSFQKKEKQPYLRGGQAVDQFFFGMMDKLVRRAKGNQAGAGDALLSRITAYDDRLIAEERERRRLAEAEAARVAAAAARKLAEEQAEAERLRLAAERARTDETRQAKAALAAEAEQKASAAAVEATLAAETAEVARVDTYVKPADIVRHRGSEGTLSTGGTEKYAEITDRDALDMNKLRPFIDFASLEKALRAWARTTDFNVPMAGAAIGKRNKSRVR